MSIPDERYKKIMSDLGMPNSQSLLVALQQVANEAAQNALRSAGVSSWATPTATASLEALILDYGVTSLRVGSYERRDNLVNNGVMSSYVHELRQKRIKAREQHDRLIARCREMMKQVMAMTTETISLREQLAAVRDELKRTERAAMNLNTELTIAKFERDVARQAVVDLPAGFQFEHMAVISQPSRPLNVTWTVEEPVDLHWERVGYAHPVDFGRDGGFTAERISEEQMALFYCASESRRNSPATVLQWLEDRTKEGCVTMCFEMDGGVHVTLEPLGGEERAARHVNSVREGVLQLMAKEQQS
jgi:hypothetical protein